MNTELFGLNIGLKTVEYNFVFLKLKKMGYKSKILKYKEGFKVNNVNIPTE